MVTDVVSKSFSTALDCLKAFIADEEAQRALAELTEAVAECFESGGKLISAGNGGSMADAMHFTEEWTGRFRSDRKPLPAMVASDATHLSCVANDYGYDHTFSRIVEAFARPGDLVFLLSTSGNSENLVMAAKSARTSRARVVGFLGRGGGRLAPLCDIVIMAPGETSDRIQEIHMMCLHILIEAVEHRLGLARGTEG